MSTHASLAPAEQPASSTSPTTGAPAALEAAFAGVRRVPAAVNEPVKLRARICGAGRTEGPAAKMAAEKIEIPLIIGGKEIRTGQTEKSVMPHDHGHVLAEYHVAGPEHIAAGDRRGRRRAPRVGRPGRGKTAPRCCCAPPSCSPRRGARRSTPRRCSASRRRCSRRRSTRPAR